MKQEIKQSKHIDFYAGKALIWGLIGVGGSGKTVLSIIYIIQNIHKFKILATNIKGLKVNLIKHITGHDFEYVELFERDKHGIQLATTQSDVVKHMKYLEELNRDLPEDKRFTSLNIVDECHKIFIGYSKKEANEVYLSNFLSETRHFGPAYWIFMTQNHKKIHHVYKGDVAFWYITQQQELKKNDDFIHFKKFGNDLDTRIDGENIIFNRFKDAKFIGVDGKEYNYFDLYVSGDGGRQTHKTKSMVAKKLLKIKLMIFGVIIFVSFTAYLMYNLISKVTSGGFGKSSQSQTTASQQKKENNSSSIAPSHSITQKKSNLNIKDRVLIKILYKNGIYFIGDIKLTETQFQVLKQEFNIFILTRQTIFNNYQYLYCFISQDVAISLNLIKENKKMPNVGSFVK